MKEFKDMNEFSSHPSAILSDGSYSIFVKLSTAANGQEQFEIELAGLRLLSELSGVRIPTFIGNIPFEGGIVMVLEGVLEMDRTATQWRQIGQTLAQIHQNKGRQFGLDTHNYFGPLYQDNRPLSDWPTFYAERRLWPRFMGAINSGNMPTDVIRQVEKLILRIPKLCDASVVPTLLHGDAQQNNFISTEMGAVVIDPAVYYGHPEMDLAYVDYFRPVSDDLFNGYKEVLPIDSGFWERRDLWRIYGYLAIAEVEGAPFLPQLTNAVRKYV
jgi:protein-ribulosamine 3-kinase